MDNIWRISRQKYRASRVNLITSKLVKEPKKLIKLKTQQTFQLQVIIVLAKINLLATTREIVKKSLRINH